MIICLDYGERYVGVSMTDYEEKIALRHSTIDQKSQDAIRVIKNLIEKEEIDRVLVGVPISLSGNETAQTRVSLEFMEKMRQELGGEVEVEAVDETLTSVEAERHIRQEGGKPDEAHAEAARIMLEDYLRKIKKTENAGKY